MPNLPFRPPPFFEEPPPPSPRPRRRPARRAPRLLHSLRSVPWFALSAIVHIFLLLLLAVLSVRPTSQEVEYPGAFEVGFYREPADALAETVAPPAEETPDQPEPEPEPIRPEPEPPPKETPTPDPPAESPQPAAEPATTVVTVEGAGRPKASAFDARSPAARPEAVRTHGGSPGSERAVDMGLDWLRRHQDPASGGWTDGDPQHRLTPGLTGLALLAFLGRGHTHVTEGAYQRVVARAIACLRDMQTAHGRFGPAYQHGGQRYNPFLMYHQGIATLALAEAYALSHDHALADPVRRAVRFIERAQQAGGGWDYGDLRTARNDTSVTGWQLMALKSAHAAGIEVGWQTLFGAMSHFHGFTRSTGEVVYADRSHGVGRRGPGMAAVGMLCRQMLGWPRDSDLFVRQANFLQRHMPDWPHMAVNNPKRLDTYLHTVYYWYHGTLALFHMGGPWWETWNVRLRDLLVGQQLRAGERRGSWDPPERGFDSVGGRVYMTAMSVLILEVYYRYLPFYRTGSFDAVGVLAQAARVHGLPAQRRRALDMLGDFPDERAQAILVAALEDPDAAARAIARGALIRKQPDRVVPALLADLDSDSPFARTQAVDALGKLGRRAFIPHFIRMLGDEERIVRLRALRALQAVTGEKLGFEPDAPTAERQAQLARWREWWDIESQPLPPEGIRGAILVVDPRTPDSIVLDVGRAQRVRRGIRFEVRRDDEVIAILRAEKVEPT
ncbi:HEAT repeat domain-containing protein, partial [bacterium]|nr:HEAT repeat domain-containing protein [bacterium]